jgi:hypothetical protein
MLQRLAKEIAAAQHAAPADIAHFVPQSGGQSP